MVIKKFHKRIIFFITSHEYLFLFGIILLGALIRLALLPTTDWFGDPAHDLLVPQHILFYHEVPNLGHVASGTNPVFYYPPLYFYLLTVLQIPSTNIWYILTVVIISNSASIGVLYLLAKRLSNSTSAFITAAFYTFSYFILRNQFSLTAYRFDLPIFLTGAFFHLVGIQKRQPRVVLLGLFLLVIAASINYAILILLPVFILWTLIFFRKDLHTVAFFISFVYGLFFIIFFSLAKYIVTTYSWTVFLTPFSPGNNMQNSNILGHFREQLYVFVQNMFPEYGAIIMVAILVYFCISALNKRQQVFSILYPLSFIVTTLLLSSLKNNPPAAYYYYSVTPLFFVLLGVCFIRQKPYIFSIISAVILLFLGWVAISPSIHLFKQEHIYQKTEQAVDSIISELRQIQREEQYPNMLFMRLRVLDTVDNEWQMSAYAYFMEKKLGKLLRINDRYNNLAWIGSEDYLVIVCQMGGSSTVSWCEQRVRMLYPHAEFIKQIPSSLSHPIFLYKNKI